MVRIKKYFYVLRPILACDWILRTNTDPPIEFQELVKSEVSDTTIKEVIEKLLQRKMAGEELNEEPKIQILDDFLERKMNFYKDFLQKFSLPIKPNTYQLGKLFKESLAEAWQ